MKGEFPAMVTLKGLEVSILLCRLREMNYRMGGHRWSAIFASSRPVDHSMVLTELSLQLPVKHVDHMWRYGQTC